MGQKKNSTIFSLSLKNAEWKSKYIAKNLEESSLLLYQNLTIQDYLNKIFKHYGLILYNCKIEYNENSINLFLSFFEKESETKRYYRQNMRRINKNKLSILSSQPTNCLEQYEKQSTSNYLNCPELIYHIFTSALSKDLNLFLKNKSVNIKAQNLNKKFEIVITNNRVYLNEFKNLTRTIKRFLRDPNFKELIKIISYSIIEKDSAKLIAEGITYFFKKNKKRHGVLLSFLKKILTSLLYTKFSKIKGVKIVINGRFNGAQRSNTKVVHVGKVPLQSFNSKVSYYEDVAYTINGTFGVKVWMCR